jgi:hypothetical protein
MMHYVVGNRDMIIWWWFFFFSFVSLSFSFSPNCWHNTTTKIPSGRAHTHTHTHIYIHSLWTLALLPPTMINLLFCSNISLSIPRMCNNVLLLFSFICCYSNCKESNRVYIYLRCAMNVSLENEWLFHRYKPVGYIHSCHHTFIYTFYWRE